jgi:uroporphyrinogen-III synthase
LIREAGGEPLAFPTVIIESSQHLDQAHLCCQQAWDVIIFISRNAVYKALPLFPNNQLPAQSLIAAVGSATAVALRSTGREPDLIPHDRFDSEGLLALPALQQVVGQRILIVRGEGGRAMLGDILTQRGAHVSYAEVYRRALPVITDNKFMLDWRQNLAIATATSNEVLNNLLALVTDDRDRQWLCALPLAVLSERTAMTAMQLGFRTVAVASEASDEGLLDAVCRLLFQRRYHAPGS